MDGITFHLNGGHIGLKIGNGAISGFSRSVILAIGVIVAVLRARYVVIRKKRNVQFKIKKTNPRSIGLDFYAFKSFEFLSRSSFEFCNYVNRYGVGTPPGIAHPGARNEARGRW